MALAGIALARPHPRVVLTVCAQNQNPSLTERAYQDREILYELKPRALSPYHAFSLSWPNYGDMP